MNSSPKTTVFPIFGVLAKRRTQWVSFDVPDYGKKVFVLFNQKCRPLSGILLSLLLAPSFCHGAEGPTFSFDKGLESWQVYGEGKGSHVVGIGHDAVDSSSGSGLVFGVHAESCLNRICCLSLVPDRFGSFSALTNSICSR